MMPSVRKTTHFTDGALFSSLSLVPLLVTSPYPLDRFRFPVLSPGSISQFRLARSSFNPDYYSLSASLHISLSAPSPVLSSHSVSISAPSTVPSTIPIPVSDTVFWLKSVYREHAPHHYTQNDAATQGISCKRMYREQKTRHYWQNLQRHRLFGSKECVASGCTIISVRKSVSRTVWVQNSVSREKEVDFKRQASQQAPPCGISQKDKGCGQGGGRSRRP